MLTACLCGALHWSAYAAPPERGTVDPLDRLRQRNAARSYEEAQVRWQKTGTAAKLVEGVNSEGESEGEDSPRASTGRVSVPELDQLEEGSPSSRRIVRPTPVDARPVLLQKPTPAIPDAPPAPADAPVAKPATPFPGGGEKPAVGKPDGVNPNPERPAGETPPTVRPDPFAPPGSEGQPSKPINNPGQLRPITAIMPFQDYDPNPNKDDPCRFLCPRPGAPCPTGSEAVRCPTELTLSTDVYTPRMFPEAVFHWEASNLYSNPLYFEDFALERYGHTYPDCIQPFVSAKVFATQLVGLPYQMTIDPPCKHEYSLGYYRPGDCAPKKCYQVPLNFKAGLVQGAVTTGAIFLFP